ncbi:fasciculation and elongation protein zeta-2 [Zootermopsis nevadensis]|uniref:fasciculation and elongation protein zeta-2 n=1 Tax=Zootermopsis nevadensis TaxID=136037 RepID=UPI000B8E8CDA|nr:fasciculation and elongation protein zeta-2 [Zootermopsis nevadensis]
MRDMVSKMAELKFEAPLAQFEETEDWGVMPGEFQQHQMTSTSITGSEDNFIHQDARNSNNFNKEAALGGLLSTSTNNGIVVLPPQLSQQLNDNDAVLQTAQQLSSPEQKSIQVQNLQQQNIVGNPPHVGGGGGGGGSEVSSVADNFTETFSGSLEDLVNTFDDKITRCFCNYDESVEKLAPVQVRTQEEIMNECQMWWTITGNFGNILPIDWSKSYARKLHMPALNLNENKETLSPDDDLLDLSSEDEAVANDLDMHSLILSGLHQDTEPVKTAEEVIREIDDMMQETPSTECSPDSDGSLLDSTDTLEMKGKEVFQSPLYEDKLITLSLSQLNELYLELEVLIREFSETLIAELALRDELEYEKELKNTFISLLLAVQNKRRQYHVERKRTGRSNASTRVPNGLDPKYLTTVIPYHLGSGPPDNQALQVLIKILKAINEDSPTVPTLLTDYILKVLCPT